MYDYTLLILMLVFGSVSSHTLTAAEINSSVRHADSGISGYANVNLAVPSGQNDIILPAHSLHPSTLLKKYHRSTGSRVSTIDFKTVLEAPLKLITPSELARSYAVPKKFSMLESTLGMAFKEWQGTPYVYGGNTPSGIDCSAFIQQVFREYLALDIPRTTRQQIKKGKRVKRDELQIGDLVFFKTGSARYHVGVMIRGHRFIHASSSRGVTISSLHKSYWIQRYIDGRRIL